MPPPAGPAAEPCSIGPEKPRNFETILPKPAFAFALPLPAEEPLKAVIVVSTPVVKSLAIFPSVRILGDTTAVTSVWKSLIGTGCLMSHCLFFSILARSSCSMTRVLVSRKLSIFCAIKLLSMCWNYVKNKLTPKTNPRTAFFASSVASGNFLLLRPRSSPETACKTIIKSCVKYCHKNRIAFRKFSDWTHMAQHLFNFGICVSSIFS